MVEVMCSDKVVVEISLVVGVMCSSKVWVVT